MSDIKECLKDEYILEIGNYDKARSESDLLALAINIQTLILIKPLTYPNHPSLGVGISNYIFEVLDDATLLEIENRINNQIATYIKPGSLLLDLKVNKITNDKTGKENAILIVLYFSKKVYSDNVVYLSYSSDKIGRVYSNLYYSH
jgi:hypothetical protein